MIVFLAVGLCFAVFPWVALVRRHRALQSRARLMRSWVPAEAMVIDLATHRTSVGTASGGGSGISTTFAPVVRFTLPDGRVVEAESAERTSPPPARPGQLVTVRYDAADPRQVSLTGTATLSAVRAGFGVAAWLFAVIGSFFGLTFVAIGLIALRAGAPLWP